MYTITTPIIYGEEREDIGTYYKRLLSQAKNPPNDYISRRGPVTEIFCYINHNGVEKHAYLPIELVEHIVGECSIDTDYIKPLLIP